MKIPDCRQSRHPPILAEREAVDLDEDELEALDPDVKNSIDETDLCIKVSLSQSTVVPETYVEVQGEDDWLAERQEDRHPKGVLDNVLPSHLGRINLSLTLQVLVAGALPQTAGSAEQNVFRRGLGQAEEEDSETEAIEPEQDPESPSPA